MEQIRTTNTEEVIDSYRTALLNATTSIEPDYRLDLGIQKAMSLLITMFISKTFGDTAENLLKSVFEMSAALSNKYDGVFNQRRVEIKSTLAMTATGKRKEETDLDSIVNNFINQFNRSDRLVKREELTDKKLASRICQVKLDTNEENPDGLFDDLIINLACEEGFEVFVISREDITAETFSGLGNQHTGGVELQWRVGLPERMQMLYDKFYVGHITWSQALRYGYTEEQIDQFLTDIKMAMVEVGMNFLKVASAI